MPSPTKRTLIAVIFSFIRCCSSLTPGLLNPAFKPLGGRGPTGLFALVFGPEGLTNGLLKFCPGFLNPLIVTSAFLVYCFFLKSFSIVVLINLANSSIDITPISPLPCSRTATFPSASSFSPTTSI